MRSLYRQYESTSNDGTQYHRPSPIVKYTYGSESTKQSYYDLLKQYAAIYNDLTQSFEGAPKRQKRKSPKLPDSYPKGDIGSLLGIEMEDA